MPPQRLIVRPNSFNRRAAVLGEIFSLYAIFSTGIPERQSLANLAMSTLALGLPVVLGGDEIVLSVITIWADLRAFQPRILRP